MASHLIEDNKNFKYPSPKSKWLAKAFASCNLHRKPAISPILGWPAVCGRDLVCPPRVTMLEDFGAVWQVRGVWSLVGSHWGYWSQKEGRKYFWGFHKFLRTTAIKEQGWPLPTSGFLWVHMNSSFGVYSHHRAKCCDVIKTGFIPKLALYSLMLPPLKLGMKQAFRTEGVTQ